MTAWGDSELLVELLDRRAKFVLELEGRPKLIQVRSFIAFLEGEPRLKAILNDFEREAGGTLREHNRRDATIREKAEELWNSHRDEMFRKVEGASIDQVNNYGSLETFSDRVAKRPSCNWEAWNDDALASSENLVRSLNHWWNHRRGECVASDHTQGEVQGLLDDLRASCEFNSRSLRESQASLPALAHVRLVGAGHSTNPKPPTGRDDVLAHARFQGEREFADHLAEADERGLGNTFEGQQVDEHYAEVTHDLRLLYEEIRLRIGLQRSRIALVQRFAARCEAFDAKRLRTESRRNRKNAERLLTLHFAKHLFDAGLNPIIDPTISGLRPDVVYPGSRSLLYVEAKQYDARSPRTTLRKAFAQVWGTWSRLRNRYYVPEAFLLVFRRGGPMVALPGLLEHNGVRLHPVIVDISAAGGSKELGPPLDLNEQELLPQRSKPPASSRGVEAP